MHDENTPVLIVGGGAVGLSAALLLSQLGVRTLLIERRATTSNHPRARGLNYRTMEIFRSAGLEDAIREAGAALANIKLSLLVETLAGKEIRRFGGFEDAESLARLQQLTPVTWCFCAQDELEPLLVATAQNSGAEIRFGTELVALEQDQTGVTATVLDRNTDTQHKIRAAYLLATDGAHSFVRQELEIGQSGRGTIGHYIGIYFRADLSELIKGREFAMCFVKNAAAPGTLSSVNNRDRWVFNLEYEPGAGNTAADFDAARCVKLVQTMVGLPTLKVELLNVQPWEAAVQIADRYQVGRIFLAGDAVHVMPPAGAFGLNTGIQDVHNLAWKLAEVLDEQADPALLDSYEAERRPVGQVTVEQAALRLDFRGGGRPKSTAPIDAPKLLEDLDMILGYRYNSAAVSEARFETPFDDQLKLEAQSGTRAPHYWLEKEGKQISTLDLFGKNYVWLVGKDGSTSNEIAIPMPQKVKPDVYRIASDGDLQDPTDNWHTTYGTSQAGAVLVRPDGCVAWRS